MLMGLLSPARSPIELAEPEMAMSDERAHTARLGERPCLAEVGSPSPASNC
jgi:hypothetical protein